MTVKPVDFTKGTLLEAQLEQAYREVPQYIKTTKFVAKMCRIRYNAYLKEGFTAEQALFLCKET